MLIINCLFSIGKKGSSGVCGVEMWKKSTVGIPQFPSLPLKSCCRPLLVALFIGGSVVVATGCYAQVASEEVAKIEGINIDRKSVV